jgi:hypothetical protein
LPSGWNGSPTDAVAGCEALVAGFAQDLPAAEHAHRAGEAVHSSYPLVIVEIS